MKGSDELTSYEKYKQLRAAHNLRDADVSRGTGVSAATLSSWSKMGQPGGYEPKIEKRQRVANFFGVPLGALIGD